MGCTKKFHRYLHTAYEGAAGRGGPAQAAGPCTLVARRGNIIFWFWWHPSPPSLMEHPSPPRPAILGAGASKACPVLIFATCDCICGHRRNRDRFSPRQRARSPENCKPCSISLAQYHEFLSAESGTRNLSLASYPRIPPLPNLSRRGAGESYPCGAYPPKNLLRIWAEAKPKLHVSARNVPSCEWLLI